VLTQVETIIMRLQRIHSYINEKVYPESVDVNNPQLPVRKDILQERRHKKFARYSRLLHHAQSSLADLQPS
jgi:hypothetical protein